MKQYSNRFTVAVMICLKEISFTFRFIYFFSFTNVRFFFVSSARIAYNTLFSEANIQNISPIHLYRRTSSYRLKNVITNYILIV